MVCVTPLGNRRTTVRGKEGQSSPLNPTEQVAKGVWGNGGPNANNQTAMFEHKCPNGTEQKAKSKKQVNDVCVCVNQIAKAQAAHTTQNHRGRFCTKTACFLLQKVFMPAEVGGNATHCPSPILQPSLLSTTKQEEETKKYIRDMSKTPKMPVYPVRWRRREERRERERARMGMQVGRGKANVRARQQATGWGKGRHENAGRIRQGFRTEGHGSHQRDDQQVGGACHAMVGVGVKLGAAAAAVHQPGAATSTMPAHNTYTNTANWDGRQEG